MENKNIVIIGAGLTGLTAAYHISKKTSNFLVLEKASTYGGVIKTTEEKGFIYEEGPNTGVIGNIEVVRLFEELGEKVQLETANKSAAKRYILKGGAWQALPSGLISAIKTPLFTLSDKFRVLGEPFRSPGKNPHETLAEMVKRRLGKSFLDYAIDPFILGVYAGDPNRLIPKYALPKLYNLEQDYGSFIGGSVKKMFAKKDPEAKKVTRGVFSAKGGLQQLTKALYETAGSDKFEFSAEKITVNKLDKGFEISYIQNGETKKILANQVITTVGAYELSAMLPFISKEKMDKISNCYYTKVVESVIGFDSWNGFPLDGFGGLIPSKEKFNLLGALFISTIVENRAPKGGALFSVFLGGVRNEALTTKTESELKAIIEKEFVSIMKLNDFKPSLFKVIWHEKAIPQYGIESGERFEAIAQTEKEFAGLQIGGNLRNGIGMADRILQGTNLAKIATEKLSLQA